MDNAITTPEESNGDDGLNFHPVEPLNISENYEDPPQMVENIHLSFKFSFTDMSVFHH